MEIINRLKNTPTGLIVLVGDMKIIVEKYRPYYNGQNKIPCRGCVFRDEGARFCEYSKAKSQTYRIDFQKTVEMHERGMTQTEIANELGTTQKVIYNSFRRNGYKCRKAAKRNQLGKNNNSWVGDNATYATFHKRVESLYGRPIHCEVCGTVDPSKRYEWANVTGDYADVEHGYRRMCCSCHRKFDKSKEGGKNNVKRKK